MAKRPPDIQVLISYKDLCALLEAAEQVDSLNKKHEKLQKQFDALNERFLELMIAFGDLRRYVID